MLRVVIYKLLNKMDIPGTEQVAKIIQTAIEDRQVLMISAATRKGIELLKLKLVEILDNLHDGKK